MAALIGGLGLEIKENIDLPKRPAFPDMGFPGTLEARRERKATWLRPI
jgi:hypothetical protein